MSAPLRTEEARVLDRARPFYSALDNEVGGRAEARRSVFGGHCPPASPGPGSRQNIPIGNIDAGDSGEYMTFRNFSLVGDERIASLAEEAPFRAERLIGALEAFIAGGPSTLIARDPRDELAAPELELRLIPPRHILRAVPDAMAIVLVAYSKLTLVLVRVDSESMALDDDTWQGLAVGGDKYLKSVKRE